MRVLFLQFLKGSWHYGELDAAEALNAASLSPALGGTSDSRPRARSIPHPPADNFVDQAASAAASSKSAAPETDPEDIRLVEEAWAESAALPSSPDDWDLVVARRDQLRHRLQNAAP